MEAKLKSFEEYKELCDSENPLLYYKGAIMSVQELYSVYSELNKDDLGYDYNYSSESLSELEFDFNAVHGVQKEVYGVDTSLVIGQLVAYLSINGKEVENKAINELLKILEGWNEKYAEVEYKPTEYIVDLREIFEGLDEESQENIYSI